MLVIYKGIDIEKYDKNPIQEKRRDFNISDDVFVVEMVGRISTQKAPDVFIRVAKEIKKEIPNAFFVIVGSGEMEEEMRVYARNNNLVDVIPNIIVDNENGLLVEMNDFDVAAKAVMKINEDNALANKLSENGFRSVLERFDIRRVVEEHEKMLFEVYIKDSMER